MIQNRIVELSKTVQQLQSYNRSSMTHLQITQQQQQQQQANHYRDNKKDRSSNVFVLDLSRSDFFDTMMTSTSSDSNGDDDNTTSHCNSDNTASTTIDDDPPPQSAPLLHHDEMDVAVQEFQNQIRDMIHTTILSSTSTMEQIRDWIQNELRNETMKIVQQSKKSNDAAAGGGSGYSNNNDIVRTIVAQRILEKQADVEWHSDNADDIHQNMDYASILHGSTILYATPSLIHTLPILNRILSFLLLRFYGHTAEMILTPKVSMTTTRRRNDPNVVLGQCWSFLRTKPAMVVIQMGQSIRISSVSIEHPLASTTETAIRTFHVYGHADVSSQRHPEQESFVQGIPQLRRSDNVTTTQAEDGWYYLGTFVHDVTNSIPGTNGLVVFSIPTKHRQDDSPIPPLRIIRLHIDPIVPDTTTATTTNESKYHYSCLYRFRVHGEPASTTTIDS